MRVIIIHEIAFHLPFSSSFYLFIFPMHICLLPFAWKLEIALELVLAFRLKPSISHNLAALYIFFSVIIASYFSSLIFLCL